MLAEFPAQQGLHAEQLPFGEEVRRGEFVPSGQRIGMALRGVHAVRPSRVAPPADDVGDERVRDGCLGFGRDFVRLRHLRGALRKCKLRGDLAEGGIGRLTRRAAELFQFEEIACVGGFDGAQGGGFLCVGDRGEAVFDLASVCGRADEGVDCQHAELGNDGLPRAGCRRRSHACDQYGGFDVFHGLDMFCIYRKDTENAAICGVFQKKS